jgi:hypothetical protein
MEEAARRAQLRLPAGIDRGTRQTVTLERVLAEPEAIASKSELSAQERIGLVRSRWEAGAWSNIVYCDTAVDLTHAVGELTAQSKLGRDLQQCAERAIEMAVEDVQA